MDIFLARCSQLTGYDLLKNRERETSCRLSLPLENCKSSSAAILSRRLCMTANLRGMHLQSQLTSASGHIFQAATCSIRQIVFCSHFFIVTKRLAKHHTTGNCAATSFRHSAKFLSSPTSGADRKSNPSLRLKTFLTISSAFAARATNMRSPKPWITILNTLGACKK